MKKHKKKEKKQKQVNDTIINEHSIQSDTTYKYVIKCPVSNEVNIFASKQKLEKNDSVIIPTKFGNDYAVVLDSTDEFSKACNCSNNSDCKIDENQQVSFIIRKATCEDDKTFNDNKKKIPEVKAFFNEKVEYHKLDMKYIDAHFLTGDNKLIIFFTSEKRVDFRDLVKSLVEKYKTRIELRQLRPREESMLIGGLGVCGRDYCCHSIKTGSCDSVTIKMAKEQNLSLNSIKISGPCGRLLCCLGFEYEQYVDEKKFYPSIGTTIKVGDEIMRVTEVNIINSSVRVKSDDNRFITIPYSALSNNAQNNRWNLDKSYYDEFINI